jgi:hypothetical protein
VRYALVLLALAGVACERVPPVEARAHGDIDPELASEIARIKAIDNHAHPVRPVAAGEAPDMEFDALPVDHLEPASDPVRTRPHPLTLRTGAATPEKVLDQLGIDIMLANRVAMGPGLPSDRFLWVPYADALMYPLSNESIIHNSDQKAFFALEETPQALLRRVRSQYPACNAR